MIRIAILIIYPVCSAIINSLFGNREREIIVLRQQILILKRQLARKRVFKLILRRI